MVNILLVLAMNLLFQNSCRHFNIDSTNSHLCIAAGDYVKFNLPGAQALTTLAWGGISYQAGYKCAGEFENLLDAIKWGTDYFMKCHVSDNEYYAQVLYLKSDSDSLK